MTYGLHDLLERMDHNLAEHACHLHRTHAPMTVEESADILISDSGLADDTFNLVARARFTEQTAAARIRDIVAATRATKRPFSWWVGPTSTPNDLSQLLVKAGLPASDPESAMWIDLNETVNPTADNVPHLHVEVATEQKHLVDYAAVLAKGWDPPSTTLPEFVTRTADAALQESCPARYLVGYVDDVPMATGEVFFFAGVAGIYAVMTAATHCRRGYGTAMMVAALELARAYDHPIVVLQASAEGEHLYRTLGFQTSEAYVEHPIR